MTICPKCHSSWHITTNAAIDPVSRVLTCHQCDVSWSPFATTPPPQVVGTAPGSPVSHGGVEPGATDEVGAR